MVIDRSGCNYCYATLDPQDNDEALRSFVKCNNCGQLYHVRCWNRCKKCLHCEHDQVQSIQIESPLPLHVVKKTQAIPITPLEIATPSRNWGVIGVVVVVAGVILALLLGKLSSGPNDITLPTTTTIEQPMKQPVTVPSRATSPTDTQLPKKTAPNSTRVPTSPASMPAAAPVVSLPTRINGKDGSPMVLIVAGDFIMGSTLAEVDEATRACRSARGSDCDFGNESPQRTVSLPDFYIHQYEVTEGQYYGSGGNLPVANVTWDNARDYCARNGMRLPTQEEWEKAARGSDGRTFPWGNSYNARYLNSKDSGRDSRMPVGSYENGKSPNGVYDMAGNVWEWTNSTVGGGHVVRGGSYANKWWYVRSANHGAKGSKEASPYTGFRCVQDVP